MGMLGGQIGMKVLELFSVIQGGTWEGDIYQLLHDVSFFTDSNPS
jgi:hypothetical protein